MDLRGVFKALLVLSSISLTLSSLLDGLRAEEVAIVQFDSRAMSSYWLASANWNKFYCDKHGHKFLYFQAPKGKCLHDGEVQLADPWCKVRTMQQATEDHPDVKLFVYMDSDAVVDTLNFDTSVLDFAKDMQRRLDWDVSKKPIIFNQDGPCWWCSLVAKKGYHMCLNAGTVMWYRHPISSKVLSDWWNAAMDSYDDNPLKRKFRTSWPWEQDRQMAIYQRNVDKIQVSSHPHLPFMPREHGSRKISDWCFSHLPGSGCFISHFCANHHSKEVLNTKYQSNLEKKKREKGGSQDILDAKLYDFTIEQLRMK